MKHYVQEIIVLAGKYGLKVSSIDATDVTLLARLELLPEIFIQIYRNSRKGKLNLALIIGENRIYGFDSEGGVSHSHPIEAPETHVINDKAPTVEEFILECIIFAKDRELL